MTDRIDHGDLETPDFEMPPAIIEGMGGGPAFPVAAPSMSQAEKDEYEEASDIFMTAAKAFAGAATVLSAPTFGAAGVVFGILAGASAGMSILLNDLANDPPQPAYAKPVVFKQRTSVPPQTNEPALAPLRVAIQQGVFGTVTAKGYLDALERLQGAYNASDATWTTVHRGTAYIAYRQLVVDLASNGAALNAAGKVLKGSKYDVELKPDAGSVKRWIESKGVQADLTTQLQASGFTTAEINRAIAFFKGDPMFAGPAVPLSSFITDIAKKVYGSASKLRELP